MQINLDISNIVNVISIIISAFLGVHFLIFSKNNRKANFFLGLFLIFTSVSVLGSEIGIYLENSMLIDYFSYLMTPICFAIILFNYSIALTNSYKKKKKALKWMCLVYFVEVTLNIVTEYLSISVLSEESYYVIVLIIFLFSYAFSLFILVLIMKEIRIHNNHILKIFSSIENKQLNWLKHLIIINIGFLIIWFIDDSLMIVIGENIISESIAEGSLFATLITILWMGFAGLPQGQIFEPKNTLTDIDVDTETVFDDALVHKYEELKQNIEKEKIYIDQDLTINSLSKKLNIKEKELSRIINQGFKNNFYHFINQYRVEHFKKNTNHPDFQNLSIEGQSQMSGFKSKSTFYAAFKKIEGVTPKEYMLRKK